VAVSEDACDLVRDAVGGEFQMLFNGIEAERFRNAEPWPTTGPTVLFIGRHEERKGLSTLLEAVPSLPAEVTVWVAGEGPRPLSCASGIGIPASSGSAASTTTNGTDGWPVPRCSVRRRSAASRSA
jgi:glycosyltransferase involved in cell wall biosynthesis